MKKRESSIRQNAGYALPDWRNLGVLLRVLLGVNLLALAEAFLQSGTLYEFLETFLRHSAWVEPILLFVLSALAFGRNLLWRCPAKIGGLLVFLLSLLGTALFWGIWDYLSLMRGGMSLFRALLLSAGCTGAILYYFELRTRAFSPRIEEARLQALNARIRPHFLFNSLNTVLALIRSNPRRAETALEEFSELFRTLMRDPRELVPLSDEIALCRQYLDLEKLRLGERLQVRWEIHSVPMETMIPPLMLQPLLENAVLHGVEMSCGGEIRVFMHMKGEMLSILVENPIDRARQRHIGMSGKGNHMALGNIRARLSLYYDMEARLEHGPKENLYRVTIELPCRPRKILPL